MSDDIISSILFHHEFPSGASRLIPQTPPTAFRHALAPTDTPYIHTYMASGGGAAQPDGCADLVAGGGGLW